jgi:hypothetical protein
MGKRMACFCRRLSRRHRQSLDHLIVRDIDFFPVSFASSPFVLHSPFHSLFVSWSRSVQLARAFDCSLTAALLLQPIYSSTPHL